jgi:hypothetical protein
MITNVEKKPDCTVLTFCVDVDSVNVNHPESDAKKVMYRELCEYFKTGYAVSDKDNTEVFKNNSPVLEKVLILNETLNKWVYRMSFTVYHVLAPVVTESPVVNKTVVFKKKK